jgi:hypothetical protein
VGLKTLDAGCLLAGNGEPYRSKIPEMPGILSLLYMEKEEAGSAKRASETCGW